MKTRHFFKIIKIPTTTIIRVDINPESIFDLVEYNPKPIKKFTLKGLKTEKYLIRYCDKFFKTPEDCLDYIFKKCPNWDTNAFKVHSGKIYRKFSIIITTESKDQIITYHDNLEDLLAYSKELLNLFGGLEGLYDENLKSIREFILNADPESLNNE